MNINNNINYLIMERDCISLNGKLYRIKNGKLFDIAFGHNEVDPATYVYITRPGQQNILAIQNKVFWHENGKYQEASTFEICRSDKMNFYCIIADNPLDCCVFYQALNTEKVVYMGRKYEEILEHELVRIGKTAYQIHKGELIYLQRCENYEFWRDRLEIHTGEKDYSELYVYQKKYGAWTEVYHKIPMTPAI